MTSASKRHRGSRNPVSPQEAPSFEERVANHWTAAQIQKVTGGARYELLPHEAPILLRTLGLLNSDATMSASSLRKYGQINHMLNLLRPMLDDLVARHPKGVRILDAGSGSGFLSLLLAWWFRDKIAKKGLIIGVDNNEKLMEKCRLQSAELGFGEMTSFVTGDLRQFEWPSTGEERGERPNLVVALHACDTATDEALRIGLKTKADAIAVAPCCQAELAGVWKNLSQVGKTQGTLAGHPLAPVFHSPNLRREVGADMTDALRVLLLRACGYEVTATEFVPSSHTPKNRLILGLRRGNYWDPAITEYLKMRAHLGGVAIALEAYIPAEVAARMAAAQA